MVVVIFDDSIQDTMRTRSLKLHNNKHMTHLMFLCSVDLRTRLDEKNWNKGK